MSGKEPFPPLDFLVPCLWEHISALQLAVSDEIAHGWALCKLPLTAASCHAQTSPSFTSHCSLFLFIKSIQQFTLKSVSWLSLCQLIPSCPSQQAQDITHLSVLRSWDRKTISQVRRLQHTPILYHYFAFPLLLHTPIPQEDLFPKLIKSTQPVFILKLSPAIYSVPNPETDGVVCPQL